MKEITSKRKHAFAGYGLAIVGGICNYIGMKGHTKNNSRLNTAVTIVGIAASVGSMAHFFGTLYNYDDSEDDDDMTYIAYLFSRVIFPVADIYCLANSLKK